jgi:hypothetical protein
MKTSNQKYEITNIYKVDVTVDVSLPTQIGDMYFNATEIAKQFGKEPYSFLRLAATKEYMAEILTESQTVNSRFENLVRTIKGGKYKGTWLHKELAFEFAGWCSPVFRRKLHKWAEIRVEKERERKQQRLELKTGFIPLTNAIQSAIFDVKPYHFSYECNLINKLVTGMTAKKYKDLHGVNSVRDELSHEQMRLMERIQRQDASLIELGFDYQQRKQLLEKYVAKNYKADIEAGAVEAAQAKIQLSQLAKPTHPEL